MRPTIIVLIALCVSFCSAQGPMMQPKLLSQRAPDYPEAAKKLRMEGKVLLNAHIGIDGKVKGTEFAQGVFIFAGKTREISSSAELEQIDPAYKETARSLVTSARTSALSWKFSPATLGGDTDRSNDRDPVHVQTYRSTATTFPGSVKEEAVDLPE